MLKMTAFTKSYLDFSAKIGYYVDRGQKHMIKYKIYIPVTGADRLAVTEITAKALNATLIYDGSTYTANKWKIHRDRTLESPELTLENLTEIQTLVRIMADNSLSADGYMRIELLGITDETAQKTASLLKSKRALLQKAVQTDAEIKCVHEHRTLTFPFYPATLEADRLSAFIALTVRLTEFAGALKYTTAKQKRPDSEKYAMRVFLVRIGLNGDDSKAVRKALLKHMNGDSAFRSGKQRPPYQPRKTARV